MGTPTGRPPHTRDTLYKRMRRASLYTRCLNARDRRGIAVDGKPVVVVSLAGRVTVPVCGNAGRIRGMTLQQPRPVATSPPIRRIPPCRRTPCRAGSGMPRGNAEAMPSHPSSPHRNHDGERDRANHAAYGESPLQRAMQDAEYNASCKRDVMKTAITSPRTLRNS